MKETKKDLIIALRKGTLQDLNALQKLFVETVRSVCCADYNEEQINVWASSVKNTQRWNEILTNQMVLVAQCNDKIVGFSSLDNTNYIDLLYVHKDYQGQGIAKKLYMGIEKIAVQHNQTELSSDVSITARPFFEKLGFMVTKKQTVLRQNVELTNFKMTKKLNENPSPNH